MRRRRDFPGAGFPLTWYPTALANKLANTDLIPGASGTNADDIHAQFNSNLGGTNPDGTPCLTGFGWYYGLDGKHGTNIDLVTVLLHEFAHGLGFASFVDETNGTQIKNRTDIYSRQLLDNTLGLTWDNMTTAQRKQSAINTRNVHRSNMLMGFPYGKDFVYDEMVLTGAGEKGEANAKKVMAANSEKTGPNARKPGEGPSKEEQENGLYDLLYVAVAPDGREVRASVKGDRDPGYGSTSKMISECAICLLRDTPDVPAGFWTPGAAMQGKLIKRLVDHAGLTFQIET